MVRNQGLGDLNADGTVNNLDVGLKQASSEIQIREEKFDSQKRMAWIAMISMIIFTALLFSPFIEVMRVEALSDLIGLFFISQAGVVGAYMGFSSYIQRN